MKNQGSFDLLTYKGLCTTNPKAAFIEIKLPKQFVSYFISVWCNSVMKDLQKINTCFFIFASLALTNNLHM